MKTRKSVAKKEKAETKKEEKGKKLQKKTSVKSKSGKGKRMQIQQEVKAPSIEFKVEVIDGKKQVTLHSKYTIDSTHNLFNKIDKLIEGLKQKQKTKDKKLMKIVQYSYYPTFEFELQGVKPDHDRCCICQFEFSDRDYEKELQNSDDEDILQLKCSHMIHIGCLRGLIGDKQWIRCPVCFTIFGIMMGDQPHGTMTTNVVPTMRCDGYPDVGTIVIRYSMSGGTRNGVNFHGTGRTAYLPDNKQGNQVLELLRTAFNRKLIFTVGRSVTTGMDNCVVWNGIHHKTHTHGGSSHFGYPDPTYFDRVKLELAGKGVY